LSLFQNPVGFGQALEKTGQKPGFSPKSKEAVPKTEVLEQPLLSFAPAIKRFYPVRLFMSIENTCFLHNLLKKYANSLKTY
jgi:hypothetical protein